MPGYILHLTAAQMALRKFEQLHHKPLDFAAQNAFFLGNLLPDTTKNKKASHFRNPKYCENMVEYPDLNLFLGKYESLLEDVSCLGYYFHLYIDRKFFKEYLPKIITFLDAQGQPVRKRDEVIWVQMNRTKQRIPREVFYSEAYYYGDFTRVNTYLIERYQLPMQLEMNVENPGITEVDYVDISKVLEELRGYLDVPAEAIEELRVFEIEDLLRFLKEAVEEFVTEKLFKNLGLEVVL